MRLSSSWIKVFTAFTAGALGAVGVFAHGLEAPRADGFRRLHDAAPATQVVLVEGDVFELAAHGFDLAQHGSQTPGEPVEVVARPGDRERLAALGYTLIETPGVLARGTDTLDEDWNSLAEVTARVDALVAANPDIFSRRVIGTSVEGRPVVTVQVSSTPGVLDPAKPKVAFNANHHAREVMTVEAALDILGQLAALHRAGDPAAARWIAGLEVYVTPVVNPDGYHHVMSKDTWWRKNRRKNAGGSFGVDLNRNYPYAWGANDSGSSGRPSSETYRGTGPASEPEAAAVVALAREVKPLFNLSYHSYGEVLLYPYGYENAKNPVGDVMEELSTAVASRMKTDTGAGHFGKRSRLYPVNGLDRDWYYHELGTYSFVPEISNRSRGFHPSYSWVKPTVEGLRGAWRYLLDRALGEGVRGRVVDLETGAAIDAAVRVEQVTWRNGEVHRTDAAGGFSKLLKAGSYDLVVTADGYGTQHVPVVVPPGGLARVTVALSPAQ